jgi:hypothetical protein
MSENQIVINDVSEPIGARLNQMIGPTLGLQAFLDMASELGLAERLEIVDQALLVVRDLYVHRPLKEAQLAVQPVRRLELMRLDLERRRRRAQKVGHTLEAEELPHPVFFHQELTEIFTSVRDRHMRYLLPFPFRGSWATLGFEMEAVHEEAFQATRSLDARRVDAPRVGDRGSIDRDYIVTRVLAEELDEGYFQPGVKVVSWNGAAIETAVAHNGDKTAGSNLAARHARGLFRLTLRPLWTSPPPQQDWVIIGYRVPDEDGPEGWSRAVRYARFGWWVIPSRTAYRTGQVSTPVVGSVRVPRRPRRPQPVELSESTDQETAALRKVRYLNTQQHIYCGPRNDYGTAPGGKDLPPQEREPVFLQALKDKHPFWGEAYRLKTPEGTFGYLRIFTFEVRVSEFIEQLRELLPQLPGSGGGAGDGQAGLILDVRDNGGGQIAAGETLLQMLTPHKIAPMRFELLCNAATFDLCQALGRLGQPGEWADWSRSIERGSEIGALFSSGHPITPKGALPSHRGVYRGPVVLVVNALSYSTTDILAAGFKDHRIGRILSTDDNIGAGGANTVSHGDLVRVAGRSLGLRRLPMGAAMQLALRRAIRVGPAAGTPLEALGIELEEAPLKDRRYFMKKVDVLYKNACLLQEAVGMLREGVLPEPPEAE